MSTDRACVIRIVSDASGMSDQHDGAYVVSVDVDANAGHGELVATLDKSKAKVFDDAGQAMDYWRRRSTVLPTRPDGKPNRPLTAFTVEILRLDTPAMFDPTTTKESSE